MNTDFSEKFFDDLYNITIKIENESYSHDELSDLEDPVLNAELAGTSYEKDVNLSDSNSQELTDTTLVDGKIVSMCTSSPSTGLPIMKISQKSAPHSCLECCFMCKHAFLVLDRPFHIFHLRSIDKQNEILKIEPSLSVDSCLCDFCWKDLEKTYKSNQSNKKKEESFSEKMSKWLERYPKKKVLKNKNQARTCSIHFCSQSYCHKITANEFENIKQLFLKFEFCRLVFVQSRKQTSDFLKFPFCLCVIHNAMILIMSTCQICSDKLNAPFNTDDWSMYEKWNGVLIENKLPLVLKPGMFICETCKGHVSKTNPGFPTIDLPRLQEYINISNATRLKLYGGSQNNLFNICQGLTDVESPIVVPKIKEEIKCVRSTKVKFSDPLITARYDFEIGCYKNDTDSITSTALLNVDEQNLCVPKLQQKYEGLDCISVELPNAVVNPVSIKRKQSNIMCVPSSNKDVKKQRLNTKNSSGENNSMDVNSTKSYRKSYRNKNIAHPSMNSPSTLNVTSNCKKKIKPKS